MNQEQIELEKVVGPAGKVLEHWQDNCIGRERPPTKMPGPTVDKENLSEALAKLDNKALRHNQGKVDWSLLPTEPLEEIIKVLEFGKKKYAAWNWANGNGLSWLETTNSLRRHLYAWLRGEDNDPETGLSHISHVACNVIFLLYYLRHKTKYNRDDRVKLG